MKNTPSEFVIGRETQDDRYIYTVEDHKGNVIAYATTPEQAAEKIAEIQARREHKRNAPKVAQAMFDAIRGEIAPLVEATRDAESAAGFTLCWK